MLWSREGELSAAASADEENPYWMSFSDLMSGLLVIFILAAAILMLQLLLQREQLQQREQSFEQQLQQLARAEQVRSDILSEAAKQLQARGIAVTLNENHSVLRIPNTLLGFDSGEDHIQPHFRATALDIGRVLRELIDQHRGGDYLDTVFIEGHSDSQPFNQPRCADKGNWCLSTFRAISLWQLWQQALPAEQQLHSLTNGEGRALFSVSGYADSRPLQHSESAAARAQNRRIDLRFTLRRPRYQSLSRGGAAQ